MRRVPLILVAALLALLAFTAPAAAAALERERIPLGDLDLTVAAGEGCAFDVLMEDIGGTITYFNFGPDRAGVERERIWWRTTTRLTNLANPENTIEIQFESQGNYRYAPDGSVRAAFHNDSIVWYAEGALGPAGLAPGMYLVEGGVAIEKYDAEGNLVMASVEGQTTDLCAALS